MLSSPCAFSELHLCGQPPHFHTFVVHRLLQNPVRLLLLYSFIFCLFPHVLSSFQLLCKFQLHLTIWPSKGKLSSSALYVCVCVHVRKSMHDFLPVLVCLYRIHFCLTGDTAADWEPKGNSFFFFFKKQSRFMTKPYQHSYTSPEGRSQKGACRIFLATCLNS